MAQLRLPCHGLGFSAAGPSRAAESPTTTPSKNGRSSSAPDGTSHRRFPLRPSPTSLPNTNAVKAFTPPDWILVNRGGGNPTAWNTNLKSSPQTPNEIKHGRRSLRLCDLQSGRTPRRQRRRLSRVPLLPGNLNDVARKGAESYADLTQIGLTTAQVDALVSLAQFCDTDRFSHKLREVCGRKSLRIPADAPIRIFPPACPTAALSAGSNSSISSTRSSAEVATSQNTLQYLGTFSRRSGTPRAGSQP